ncbi:MAG: hypothetical protein HRU49_11920 [Winogradskyella sp.]|uniref:hypothetical protein n=1 Tax=Winogradskyella sp. TaxID=1883156 RepID=UPI0025E94092|nr:hypothetical protein [Winogradskyella sp.]NRB84464.1 hypothetical protein [Winogradskyella sp.]
MKTYFALTLVFFSVSLSFTQNIDYTTRITQFNAAGSCADEFGNEEHTWKGWLSDNINTTETYSGCVTLNDNIPSTQNGNYANRSQNNSPANFLRARIEAWEDDGGPRCEFNPTGFDADDCRVNFISNINLSNPLEYQFQSYNQNVGNANYNMNVYYQYRYSTTTLADALDSGTGTITTGGNRPFWGARGTWSVFDLDCAASGSIGNNQFSSMTLSVSCQSAVSFKWRTDSQDNADFLRVYINGVEQAAISGNTVWTLVNLPLDYGLNIIEWRYIKDGNISVGLDRGFVDNIIFTNANSLNPGAIAGSQSFNILGDPEILSSSSSGQTYGINIDYQWQYSSSSLGGWINIDGATSMMYDPPAGLTQTRFYRRRAQDNCGNTDYSNIIEVEILPQFVFELGAWDPYDPGGLNSPGSNTTHSVIIRDNTVQTNSFTTGNLIVDQGTSFTISGDVGITVAFQLQLDGTLDLGEDGQLIQYNTLVVGPNGELRKTRNGNPNLYRYTYWGSPVSNSGTAANSGFDIVAVMKDGTTGVPRDLNFTAVNVLDGIPGDNFTPATISSKWLYAFRNQTNAYSSWEQISPSTSLLSGQGFTMKGTQSTTGTQPYIFAGTPNNGDITLGVTANNNYLISNPYPSAIDSHQFLLDNPALGGTLYFWEHYGGDSHLLTDYQGGYATYNFSGGVGAPSIATPATGVSTEGTATKVPGQYIPVAQGFFVEATATGSFTFNNNQRVYVAESLGQSMFVKSANAANSESVQADMRTKIRLGMTGPNNGHRQLLLTVDEFASYGVDKYFDGQPYEVLPNDIAFYLNSEYYTIQGIPSIDSDDEIPLVINSLDSGLYNIGLDHLEHWDDNQDIYLYDAESDIYYDLRISEVSVNLVPGEYIGRFSLRFESSTTLSIAINQSIEDVLTIYQPKEEKRIVIQLSSGDYQLERVILFDVGGRAIITKRPNTLTYKGNRWSFDTQGITAGSYILQMKINGAIITRNLIVN